MVAFMDFKRFWPWTRTKKHPILVENESFFSTFDQNRPIESYEFVSLDTELTGLNPRHDQIVSIGAVRIRNLRIVAGENFFAYVRPTRALPKDSTLIHRITPEQIKNAPGLDSVLPDFVRFCGQSLLVGHYVALDMAFMNVRGFHAFGPSPSGTSKAQSLRAFQSRRVLQSVRAGPGI